MMKKTNSLQPDHYFYLFADCILTKGYTRTMITDTSRKELHFIDNSYYEVLLLCRQHTIGEINDMLEDEGDMERFSRFLLELESKKLGLFVEDIHLFPEVEKVWDYPSAITNAIIDIREVQHDFEMIFSELDELGCEYAEIRCYRALSEQEIRQVLASASGKRLKQLHLITKYNETVAPFAALKEIGLEYVFLSLTIYATPAAVCSSLNERVEKVDRMQFLKQTIDSHQCCGNIYFDSFIIPKIKNISENLLYNGCLNRKISIDEQGNIKNCPSMATSYGNIQECSLKEALADAAFTAIWNINKDMIFECNDCEYRAICTDCRAFIKDGSNILSKPSKCTYDPYTGVWNALSVLQTTANKFL